jgi:hypothetical protein
VTRAVKASSTGDIREAFGEEIVDEEWLHRPTKGPSERPACGCKQLISARMARTPSQWSRSVGQGCLPVFGDTRQKQ